MKKLILNTLNAWFCGLTFGMLLGFTTVDGMIYYNVSSGLCVGAIFACAFAIACWIVGCEDLGANND